jgi:hypothetical protein
MYTSDGESIEKHLCGSHCKCEYGETDVSKYHRDHTCRNKTY